MAAVKKTNVKKGGSSVERQEVYGQIQEMFGVVPSMFKSLPDSTLELEWQLFKRAQFDEGPIPNKYRELIGVAISAVAKCKYCSFFHTEAAKLNGATEAEIEDAVHYAKSSAGWSTYINGMQLDYGQFKKEVMLVAKHVRAMQKKKKIECGHEPLENIRSCSLIILNR